MHEQSSTPSYIYALVDPRTDEIRYVGKSSDPHRRFDEHVKREGYNRHKQNWIRQLERLGLAPELVVLEECNGDWQERERFWIAYGFSEGWPLTNIGSGGEGNDSAAWRRIWSDPNNLAKLSDAMNKRLADPSDMASWKAAMKAGNSTPEAKAKWLATMRGIWDDPEWKARRSQRASEMQADPEYRAKMAESIRKHHRSPEYRARVSARMTHHWSDPEKRKSMGEAVRATLAKKHEDPLAWAAFIEKQRANGSKPKKNHR